MTFNGPGKLLLLIGSLLLAAPLQAAVVLQYHHISEKTPPSTSVTPALFAQHMAYLAEHNFEVVPLPALVDKLRAGQSLPGKVVAITFDDAYESVYTEAFPLLKKNGWPFTVFVNTQPLDQKKGQFATWAQLREMTKHGATIANHSTEHSHLQRLRAGESRADWRQRVTDEIVNAEARIKAETGHNYKLLAYPYGEYDNQLKALLAELGYIGFAQNSGALASNSDFLALPRFPFGGVFGAMDDFTTKANTLPMPLKSVTRYMDEKRRQPVADIVVPAGTRPVLVLEFEDQALAGRVNCFASRQGAIKTEVVDGKLVVQANEALSPGRVQYNCTAGSSQRGRFHWYSQQWLITDRDGRWVHSD